MPAFSPEGGGPTRGAVADAADFAACTSLIRDGSKSFHAASLLLPRQVRPAAHALYAFCRLSDDAADTLGTDRAAALARLSARLDAVYAGQVMDHPVDRALQAVVRRFDLPRAAFDGLLEGLSWDLSPRRYQTLADLHAYAARVAGTVGVLMAALMNVRDSQRLARACDLGVAMQLTNIARDVGEDARLGRLYLPVAWLEEEGIDPDAFLTAPAFTPQLARVTARLLAAADSLYRRADVGVADLPAGCRPAIAAASRIYASIGHRLARAGYDSVSVRTVVPLGEKLGHLAGAIVWSQTVRTGEAVSGLLGAPPLAATRFLVEAAARPGGVPVDPVPATLLPWEVADRQVEWVMDLFQSMGERDRRNSGRPLAAADFGLSGLQGRAFSSSR